MDTEMCNAALDLIGAGLDTVRRLVNVETDTGDTADWFRANGKRAERAAKLRFDWAECVDYLLGTDAGGDVVGINHEPYLYAYLIPTTFGSGVTAVDVLALRGLVDVYDYETTKPKYRGPVHGYIHTDYATTEFAWKLLLDIESGFSNGLRECITYELAIRAASQFLTGQSGDQKRRLLMEEYRGEILPNAKGENQATQYDVHNETRETPWSELA